MDDNDVFKLIRGELNQGDLANATASLHERLSSVEATLADVNASVASLNEGMSAIKTAAVGALAQTSTPVTGG